MADPATFTDDDYRNDAKPHDIVLRPFHRINCPSYDLAQDKPDIPIAPKGKSKGLGRDCGCRLPSDLQHGLLSNALADGAVKGLKALLAILTGGASAIADEILDKISEGLEKLAGEDFKKEFEKWLRDLIASTVEGALLGRLLRGIPAWVPVGRKGYARKFVYPDGDGKETDKEEEREIEGRLDRSYQASIDMPQFQWSRFHHWSFHVTPLPGHRYLLGDGNGPISDERGLLLESGGNAFQEAVMLHVGNPADRTMECVIDTGAFSSSPGDQTSGPRLFGLMFHPQWPFWPTEGDWFWATGRWAFNCLRGGRSNEDELDAGQPELNPTQLNPIKAFATARYEGFQFAENEHPVPAVRFMFFASEQGGYIRFGTDTEIGLLDKDYEFIVDLPRLANEAKRDHPIGRAPAFPLNTIVLRPRLLQNLVFAPFIPGGDAGCVAPGMKFLTIDPIVEIIRPEDPNAAPTQVKVTVPLSKLEGDGGTEGKAYGFVLSLGWYDPDLSEAGRLAQIVLQPKTMNFPDDAELLRIKLGYNGKWLGFSTGDSQADKFLVPLPPITAFVPDDAFLRFFVNGTRRHGYGEYMEERPRDNNEVRKGRTLKIGGLIDTDKTTRDAIEKIIKAGQQIPAEFTVIGQILNNEFAKILLDNAPELLFGARRNVVWGKDVDAEEGTKVKNLMASAVARELFVDPLPFVNLPDEPLGWVSVRSPLPTIVPDIPFIRPAGELLKQLDESKQPTLTIDLKANARRIVPLGTGSNLAAQLNATPTLFGHREPIEYEFTGALHVSRVVPKPPPKPATS